MYYGNFESKKNVESCFDVCLDDNIVILLASYDIEWYEGSAYVLFYNKLDSKLYEVFGSHCSCYDLEGQWEPEKVSIELLREKVSRKSYEYLGLQNQIKELIKELKNGIY